LGILVTKIFLAGVAALLLATGAAHATDLPSAMISKDWCWSKDAEAYTQQEECDDNFLIIKQEGYESLEAGECMFDRIERVTQDTYQTHARCKPYGDDEADSEPWTDNLEFQLIDGKNLGVRPLDEN
jgi:hypothetical protein